MSFISSDSDAEHHSYSERTLAIIKPEAYENAEDIENHIKDNGYIILAISNVTIQRVAMSVTWPAATLLGGGCVCKVESRVRARSLSRVEANPRKFRRREVLLTPEQAAELYRGHYGRQHFPHLVAHMSSGPIIALVLAARNCIQKWRTLMGPARVVEAQAYWPDSLRASYGRRTNYSEYFNALHGSENHAEALREIHFFFPNMIVGPMLRQWQIGDYIQKHVAPTLSPALTALAHERPAEPLLWLADYLKRHNPNEPQLAPQLQEMRDEEKCHTPSPSH